jgi:phage terminase large subunit
VAWQYLKDFSKDIPGVQFNESELRAIYPNGAEIRLLGAAEPDSLRGLYLDAVVLDEAAQMPPKVWGEVIRPALADRKGKMLMIGTVFGMANIFYEFYRDAEHKSGWYRKLLTVDDTDALDADELVQLKVDMDDAEWQQEMMCDWSAAVKGSYFRIQMNDIEASNRATIVPHDPALPVDTSWDLGMADSTVVIFWQRVSTGEVRAIECIEFQNTGLPDIVRELNTRPYNYGTHILPHDAKVRELGTGKSRVEILRSLGVNPMICRNASIQDGIAAARVLLPRVWLDRDKCFRLIEALKTYRSDYNRERQVFNKSPLHSWESHFADAVRYYALMESQISNDGWGDIDYSNINRAAI